MNRNVMNHSFSRASLRRAGSAHTVLLQMAADEARAQRLRDLKNGRPGTKWRHIAEHTGVSERAVGAWAKTGAMSEDNGLKVAEFFDVDYDWFWRGKESKTPDLVGALNGNHALQNEQPVDVRLDAVEGELARILGRIERQLDAQTNVLGQVVGAVGEAVDVLREVKEMLGKDTRAADRIEAVSASLGTAADRLDAEVQRIVTAPRTTPRSAPRDKKPAAPKTAPNRSRQASPQDPH